MCFFLWVCVCWRAYFLTYYRSLLFSYLFYIIVLFCPIIWSTTYFNIISKFEISETILDWPRLIKNMSVCELITILLTQMFISHRELKATEKMILARIDHTFQRDSKNHDQFSVSGVFCKIFFGLKLDKITRIDHIFSVFFWI